MKLEIYDRVAATGRIPSVGALAEAMDGRLSGVREACRALEEKRLLVLAPDSGEIVQAPPFSAVATAFQVEAGGRTYFANCAWDALGIPAALDIAGIVLTSCGDCGDPIEIRVGGDGPEPMTCWTHFAVPAANWWDDITFT